MPAVSTSQFSGFIKPDQAKPIFDEMARASVVQQLVQRIQLGASGVEIPVVTGKPKVGWVAEAAKKPATSGTLGLKTLKPTKAAAIIVVSAEVIRANPGGYVDKIKPQLAEAFAQAFDVAALYGTGPDGTGTGPFESFLAKTSHEIEIGATALKAGGIHADFVKALETLVKAGKRLNGWVLDSYLEPKLWGAVDLQGRPVYTDLPTDNTSATLAKPGKLLGRAAFTADGVASLTGKIFGFGGDFRQAAWGQVGGISYDISKEATVTIDGEQVSCFENNLVAIRAETEFGFIVNDEAAFVKLVDKTADTVAV